MYKILIVEDDVDIQELLHDFLLEEGYEVMVASNGVEALTLFSEQSFDLVLLDLMLPKIDGFAVCEVIRQKSDIPIVMLTALDGELEQMKGYDLHADDYITKPFSMPVLVRKISAILRRTSTVGGGSKKIIYKQLVLDLDAYKVTNNRVIVDLTSREFEILRELLLHTGRVLTRKNLLELLWKYDFYGDERIVDTHIKNLRRKLKDADYIETVRGVGYIIDKEN